MKQTRPTIVYVGAQLPKRSETFVYRELLELRRRGRAVLAASVNAPERGLGDVALDQLADEAVVVYGGGAGLLTDALVQVLTAPVRSVATLVRGLCDAVLGRDVAFKRRPKVLVQCVAGLVLARRLRRRGVDVCHLHAHMAHVPATVAMYAAMALGVTWSFTGHAVDLFEQRTLLPAKLRRAAFVACISHWHRRWYRALVDLPDERAPIVRCGVDVAQFRPRPAPVEEPGGCRHVLAVGRLVPKKGFDVLIKAARILLDNEVWARVTIVGDGPERDELIELRDELNLAGDVELPGAFDNAKVRAMMNDADVVVLPCQVDEGGDRDGIPVVLMEAMACGRCVITGDLPTIRELVEDGVNGYRVTPGDSDALAEAMTRALESPTRRRQMGEAGRQRVEQEFALGPNVARLERAFDRVCPGFTAATAPAADAPPAPAPAPPGPPRPPRAPRAPADA